MQLKLETAQKQIITQKMIQSMEILQLSATELSAYIEKMSMENPVIEIDESTRYRPESTDAALQRKLDWLESTDRQNRVYYQTDRSDTDSQSNWQDIRDSGESLSEYLHAQLLLEDYTPLESEMINYIIESLDSKGYFSENIAETAAYFNVSEEEVLRLLAQIQRLDPAGIAARDLKECLLLQLHRQPEYSATTEEIIRSHLDDIAKNHMHSIEKALHVSVEEILSSCEEIRALNPIPGNSFSSREHLRYISPDAVVIKLEHEFEILINEYQYPHFSVSVDYQQLAKSTTDSETKSYLKEKIRQAEDLADFVDMRMSTLSKIMHILVERQYDFFLNGPGHKKPLRLQDIAEVADLHESTISRTLSNKYVQCQWGIYPLNYFLTHVAATSATTGEAQTTEHIKQKLQEIIDAEDKHKPLSDDAISKKLAEYDISISRRTVNKYRTSMNIPDKSGRKVWD